MFMAVIAMVLTVFNACTKDELKTLPEDGLAKTSNADVYLENGYLAFKDMNAVDSTINVLSKMSRQEKDAWEQRIGLKSARAEFDNYFDEYQKLTTIEELLKFRAQHGDHLNFNEFDETDYSIDYPFLRTFLFPLLNQNGIVKIGQSVFKYTKEKRIIILDGDVSMISHALKQNFSSKNIIVDGRSEYLKATTTDYITDFASWYNQNQWGISGNNYLKYSSDRRLLNELRCERFTYLNYSNTYNGGYRIFLYQKAQKKAIVWVNYSTQYSVGLIVYKENGVVLVNDPGTHTTGEISPSCTFNIYARDVIYNQWNEPSLSSVLRPTPMYLSCDVSCRGFNWYPFPLHYSE